MYRFEEILESLIYPIVNLMLQKNICRLCLLIQRLKKPSLVNFRFYHLFLLIYKSLKGMRNWNSLIITIKSRPSIEKAAYLSFSFVFLYLRWRNIRNYAIIVLKPRFIYLNAYLIMAVNGRCSLMNHHSPKKISLIISLLLKFLKAVINCFDLLLDFANFKVNLFNFLLNVKRCCI